MMLENGIKIIGASIGIALFLIEVIDLPKYIKKLLKKGITDRVKPFDCITCLSFWGSVILTGIFYTDVLTALFTIFTTLLTVYFIDKNIYK